MSYTYPVAWHITPKGEIKVCSARIKCRYMEYADHVEATSVENAINSFNRIAALREKKVTKAFYLDLASGSKSHAGDDSYFTSARDFSNKIASYEAEAGIPLDQIAIQGKIQLFDGVPEIRINRTFHLRENGAYGAQWTLERNGDAGRLIKRRINPYSILEQGKGTDNLSLFVDYDYTLLDKPGPEKENIGMDFTLPSDPPGEEGAALARERRDETLAFLYETVATIEANAALTRHSLRKDQVATANTSSLLEKDENGELTGKIDYANSGWRPEFLRNADTGESEVSEIYHGIARSSEYEHNRRAKIEAENREIRRAKLRERRAKKLDAYRSKSIAGLSRDFSVAESKAGAGAAHWKMTREGDQWKVRVRGTRGEVNTVLVNTKEEAAAAVEKVFAKSIQKKNLENHARRLGIKVKDLEKLASIEENQKDAIKSRVSFIGELIEESAVFEERAHRNQDKLANAEADADIFAEEGKLPHADEEYQKAKKFYE